ncbi:hypothetical protein WKR88_11255 [Trinickia caryophylli]|uniref:Uncharacterized protein n=1 Tax=Trinickia caryophylli TaxID=28094 RepID=A0A1X7E0D5_TRICW|nr:hypothetical protein [Trinickia caryophylli]PMS14078.1 hypothetical protein C0Z17_00610 [Trinickia caryophylli]TRX17775.1 hypothetical protein FNF07_05750 [Trinickia caryophylli]WQE11459.1 hypothetical protein U0034_17165 [Trinickia caryophylli]SMF25163.1 hypothetical protein SAMN06295900_104318 [Trinickia caryophylli]GLU32624.1 hypothetical protein Busp01_24660 [Trinickia caryophylli]
MTDAIVRVTNLASHDLFILGDPNWDDQHLMFGSHAARGTYRIAPGDSMDVAAPGACAAEREEYAIGMIFADGQDIDYGSAGAFQTAIGWRQDTGGLGVTDEYTIRTPALSYSAASESACSMRMAFVDARAHEQTGRGR